AFLEPRGKRGTRGINGARGTFPGSLGAFPRFQLIPRVPRFPRLSRLVVPKEPYPYLSSAFWLSPEPRRRKTLERLWKAFTSRTPAAIRPGAGRWTWWTRRELSAVRSSQCVNSAGWAIARLLRDLPILRKCEVSVFSPSTRAAPRIGSGYTLPRSI